MSKKKLIIIISIVAVVLAGAITGIVLCVNRDKDDTEQAQVEEKKEKCPVDFNALQAQNPDVYAYVEVPDTQISYPVLQKEGNKDYYSNHTIDNVEGRVPGAIYTEDYNKKDFTDPNTILYGHNMKDGSMFATLHQFENPEFFNQDRVFYIYTPEHKYTYKVFAASTISDDHLIVKYGFTSGGDNVKFAADLQNSGEYKQGTDIKGDTKLCTLFTCTADDDKRYVVVGYLTDVQDFDTK